MHRACSTLIGALLLLLVAGCASTPARAPLWVGSAEVRITPPIGDRLAGYFDERVSTGTLDPLLAKAVVLSQGKETVVFVFCDLLGCRRDVSSRIRERAAREVGIPVRNIVIACTHTHTGPLFANVLRDHYHQNAVAELGHDPKEQVYYPDFLEMQIVRAVQQAREKLAPAGLQSGFGRLEGFSFNRRYHMTNGTVQFNPGVLNPGIIREAGPVDQEVGILLATSGSGKPVAGITVFACHCDTTGGTQYSGDYPFYLSQFLRQKFGPDFISAFGAGTCGDINHINVRSENHVRGPSAERIGTNLALAVLNAVPQLNRVSPDLAVRSRVLTVPLQQVGADRVAQARKDMSLVKTGELSFMAKVETVKAVDLAAMGRTWPMEVQVFRIDRETAIVCLPGEIFVELGLSIKRQSPFSKTFVISIANDRPGYVPTLKAFKEGSYEIVNSRVEPGTGEKLVETALELLRELSQP